MIPPEWLKRKMFYFLSGAVCMVAVLWIARTSLFYFCYLPLILAPLLFVREGTHKSEIRIQSRFVQIAGFIGGMFVTEFLFSLILIAEGELLFSMEFIPEWQIILIELLLGMAVFLFFLMISFAKKKLVRRFQNPNHANKKGENPV